MTDKRMMPVPGENEEVEAHQRLVWLCVNRELRGTRMNMDDLFQVGCIGLLMGVRTFNQNYAKAKSTYYYACIRNEIAKHLTAATRQKNKIDFKSVPVDWDRFAEDLADGTGNTEDEATDNMDAERIYKMIDSMKPNHCTALRLRAEGYTLSEIGAHLGVSQQRAWQVLKRAKELLQERLDEDSARQAAHTP